MMLKGLCIQAKNWGLWLKDAPDHELTEAQLLLNTAARMIELELDERTKARGIQYSPFVEEENGRVGS